MPVIWTTPRTWANNDLIDQNMLNTHVRDNLEYLKSKPTKFAVRDGGPALNTSSTTLVTAYTQTVTLEPGVYLCWVGLRVGIVTGPLTMVLTVNGVDTNLVVGTAGIIGRIVPVVVTATASYTIAIRWRVAAGSATIDNTLYPTEFMLI